MQAVQAAKKAMKALQSGPFLHVDGRSSQDLAAIQESLGVHPCACCPCKTVQLVRLYEVVVTQAEPCGHRCKLWACRQLSDR